MITKAHEIKAKNNVKILIYGSPGSGKTTMAVSADKTLLVDFDGGVHRVDPRHLVDTVQVTKLEDFIQLLDNEDLSMYDTLSIDTIGKMLDYAGDALIKSDPKLGRKDGALTLQGYGARKALFKTIIHRCDTLTKNIIFVAHDKEEKDGDYKSIRPEVGGSSAGDLIKELDLVGYLRSYTQKRMLSFNPTDEWYGKNTANFPANIEFKKPESENRFLQGIINQYRAEQNKRSVMITEYSMLMETIEGNLDTVIDADSMNEFIEWILKAEVIWDSKTRAGVMTMEKAKALNLTLNKTTKKYETV